MESNGSSLIDLNALILDAKFEDDILNKWVMTAKKTNN